MALSNTQYREIIRGYEERQRENRRLSEERRKEIYAKLPAFSRLDEALGSNISRRISLLGSAARSENEANASPNIAEGSSPFQEIQSRRRALLQGAGYPADYLDPIYTCPDCRDTGYILSEDGTRYKCHCFRKQEVDYLYVQSNLQGILSTDRFSELSYEYCRKPEDLEHLQGAVRISLDFVKNFGDSGDNLLFYGTVGTGKSFLSGCIANELLQRGHSVVYFSAVSLFETLARYSFGSFEKETLYNFCKDLYNYELVIVDDLGTEVTNSFVQSQLFSLLSERILRGRSTIISTNLNLGEFRDRYSDRVFSRVTRSFTICLLTGPDVRMCQKLNAMPQS